MRSIVILMLAACGGKSDEAKTTKFLDAYSEVFGKIADVCMKRVEARITGATPAEEAAQALVIARATRDVTLPDPPESLASCKSDAVAAFAAVQTAIAPLQAKLDEKAAGPIATAVFLEVKPAFEASLRTLEAAWKACKQMAGTDPPLQLNSPYFVMGC